MNAKQRSRKTPQRKAHEAQKTRTNPRWLAVQRPHRVGSAEFAHLRIAPLDEPETV